MCIIRIQSREFNVDCVIFDKDGTLINIDDFWVPRVQKWVDSIADSLNLDYEFKKDVFDLLGYSISENRVRYESPLAVANMEALKILMSGIISRYGIPWHEALTLAERSAKVTIMADPNPNEIVSKGNILQTMKKLADAKVHNVIITSDNRRLTEITLSHLGITELVSAMICGDDPIPKKPDPIAAWTISKQLDISTSHMMMVGDSLTDMQFAASAGIAFRIGVASTPENKSLLAPHADALVESIDDFHVQRKKNG
jgi:phosphoglycolate phosphatase-like HAD superfamily hydrolase